MRKFFLAIILCFFSFAATAQMIWPSVDNLRNSVSFSAWNPTDKIVRCWGSIYLDLDEDRSDYVYVSETIFPYGNISRIFYPSALNATIDTVSHSVYCH